MADSACAVCGFSTNDLSDLEKHMQQHDDTFAPKMESPNLMSAPTDLMQNLPALLNYYSSAVGFSNPLFSAKEMETLLNNVRLSAANAAPKNGTAPSSAPSTAWPTPLFTESTSATSPFKKKLKTEENLVATSMSSATTRKETKSKKVSHSCPHCNFTTVMSQHMRSHLAAHKRHQGQMYQCDICQMQFSQKANMHRHRMRHSGLKPYECRYCKKRFFRKDQMQEHSMTHIKTGEDFDCPVANCESRFRQHSALRSHLEEQHTITANEHAACKRCAMTFANHRRLLLHYQTKHDDNSKITNTKKENELLDKKADLALLPLKCSKPSISTLNVVAPSTTTTTTTPQAINSPVLDLSAVFNNPASLDLLHNELAVAISQAFPSTLANIFSPKF